MIETNLIGTIHGCHAALAQFIRQALGELPPADKRPTETGGKGDWEAVEGTIINIASDLGKMPAPYYASYAASKHGVVGLGSSLRQEMHERGMSNVHICTVMPEAHDTPFFTHAANYTGHETVPLPPTHDPKKVVDAVIALLDDPKAETNVGSVSPVTHALHKLLPRPIERLTGHQVHKEQYEKAPASPPTRGAVHGPMREGTGVSGGERAKKKREKK
ncbi:MAG TPA: SDR family NAD(P)-dependent oxidoreductase [Phycisphaerales bacterium]|nr:SDR family NAD(P)-dependent oxidoreductase [Phycisphaerales bacterium]